MKFKLQHPQNKTKQTKKVSLEHSLVHIFKSCLSSSPAPKAEVISCHKAPPACKAETLTPWPFTKKVCRTLIEAL